MSTPISDRSRVVLFSADGEEHPSHQDRPQQAAANTTILRNPFLSGSTGAPTGTPRDTEQPAVPSRVGYTMPLFQDPTVSPIHPSATTEETPHLLDERSTLRAIATAADRRQQESALFRPDGAAPQQQPQSAANTSNRRFDISTVSDVINSSGVVFGPPPGDDDESDATPPPPSSSPPPPPRPLHQQHHAQLGTISPSKSASDRPFSNRQQKANDDATSMKSPFRMTSGTANSTHHHHHHQQKPNHSTNVSAAGLFEEDVDGLNIAEDPYDLAAVRIPQTQMFSFAQAAQDVTNTHQALVKSVNKLTHAVKQQHQETTGLTAQHQRVAVRIDTVWQTAVEVREHSNQLENRLERHLRYADETHRHFHTKMDRMEQLLERLAEKLDRTTLVSQRAAKELLWGKNQKLALQPFFSFWLRRAKLLKMMRVVMRNTHQGLRAKIFEKWSLFIRLKAHRRMQRRCVTALSHQTVHLHRLATFRRWIAHHQDVQRTARKLASVAFFRDKNLQQIYFTKMQRHVREKKANTAKALLLQSHNTKFQMQCIFSDWVKLARRRQVLLRKMRLVHVLSHHVQGASMQRAYSKWLLFLKTNNQTRKKLVAMRKANILRTMSDYYSRWRQLQTKNWMLQEIRTEVAQLGLKMELTMRTTSNTSETISKIMEHQHELEGKLLEIVRTKVSHHQLRSNAFKESQLEAAKLSSVVGSGQVLQMEHVGQQAVNSTHGERSASRDPSPQQPSSVPFSAGTATNVTQFAYVPPHRSVSEGHRSASNSPPQPLAQTATGAPLAEPAGGGTTTADTSHRSFPQPQPQPSARAVHAAGGPAPSGTQVAMQALLKHYQDQAAIPPSTSSGGSGGGQQ